MNILLIIVLCLIVLIQAILLQDTKKRKSIAGEKELEKWHSLAMTDELTKLNNRTAYNKKIRELERDLKNEHGLMLFDIDDFKEINDSYGHLTGDKTLQTIALMLEDVFWEEHFSVYRIGGDEFAVLGESVTEQEVIDKLLSLRRIEQSQGKLRLSKGYSMIKENNSWKEAFFRADEMLYADKATRKN